MSHFVKKNWSQICQGFLNLNQIHESVVVGLSAVFRHIRYLVQQSVKHVSGIKITLSRL